MECEDCVQGVEHAQDVGGVLAFETVAVDVVEYPAEAVGEVGDLGVAPTHRAGRIVAAEHPFESRVQLGVFGLFVREQLDDEELPHISGQLRSLFGRDHSDLICDGDQTIHVGPQRGVLGPESEHELKVGIGLLDRTGKTSRMVIDR